jgi:hypothetical protein
MYRWVVAVACIVEVVSAASLEVYQDQAKYHYTSDKKSIGFIEGAKVRCEGRSVRIEEMLDPLAYQTERLGGLVEQKGLLERSQEELLYGMKVLEQLMQRVEPKVLDAQSWIATSKALSGEYVDLKFRHQEATKRLTRLKEQLAIQAPSSTLQGMSEPCGGQIEVVIPYGLISFAPVYEARMEGEEIIVTQKLSLVNRSGIDIDAKEATFYYRYANQSIERLSFAPWRVRAYREPPRTRAKVAMVEPMVEMEDRVVAMPAPAPMMQTTASYEDAREYTLRNLHLPSIGQELTFDLLEWRSALTCEYVSYPYLNPQVVKRCSFEPKYPIESHQWRVSEKGKVINERATGAYREGEYTLYTQLEEDIVITRKLVVEDEKQTGIFGGTLRKKDGFALSVANQSNEAKKIKIIERIPTSTTQKIAVKLLKVAHQSGVSYTQKKDGKLEIEVTLNPKQTQKIEVFFEIAYDKEMEIEY